MWKKLHKKNYILWYKGGVLFVEFAWGRECQKSSAP